MYGNRGRQFVAELAGPSRTILERPTGYAVLLEAATCRRPLLAKRLPKRVPEGQYRS
jgi:hypothetical protein